MSVKVTANQAGIVVVQSENSPEYGFIRLEEKTHQFVKGWVKPIVKSALILGKVDDLKALNYRAGMELPGRIQIVETLDAPDVPNPERFIKKNSTNGIILKQKGNAIFRTSVYDDKGTSTDVFLEHDNLEEIKEYQASLKATGGEANL